MSNPRELPILFNAAMVRAILAGTKTQTRRPIKEKVMADMKIAQQIGEVSDFYDSGYLQKNDESYIVDFAQYQIGDRLYPAMEIPSLNRNYCADVYGRIWSRARDGKTWRALKSSPQSRGYLTVTPAIDGKYRTRMVHRLVCEAFYGKPPAEYKEARHLDGNQKNNRPENLDWGTKENNWTDRIAHGTGLREQHHCHKLMEADVGLIKSLHLAGRSQRQLAKKFGVSQSTICSAIRGDTWAENPIADPPNMERWVESAIGEVVDVRVERVQGISFEDCQREGLEGEFAIPSRQGRVDEIRSRFGSLWDSIYKNWDKNPWVFVYEFKVASNE